MFGKIATTLVASLLLTLSVAAADRPNILWLSCEDISPTLGCYGDPHAKSPNIDRLAKSGCMFTHAFVAAPVCAVNRSCIITGVYPISLGSNNMRSKVDRPSKIRCFSAMLRDAGYYCTNNSKTDYNFSVPKDAWDESSRNAHYRKRTDDDQPFFAVFNFTGTHESHIRGDNPKSNRQLSTLKQEQRVDPAKLEVPPYLPDTPTVRQDLARNYDNIAVLDSWVDMHLQQLEKSGQADNTIVVFWSDHGIGMTRGKRWLYDSGMHVPLIVTAPPKWKSVLQGVDGSELVSFVDFAPTMLSLAGVEVPEHMQGRVFLGDGRQPAPDYIFGNRDRMDERYDAIRSARDGRWLYIRNLMPWRPYAQYLSYAEKNPNMKEVRRLHAAGKLGGAAALFMRNQKPLEELFDTEADPYNVKNLADDPAHQERLVTMRNACQQWCKDSRDLASVPESYVGQLERKHGPRYDLYRGVLGNSLDVEITAMWRSGEMLESSETTLASDNAVVRYWSTLGYDGSDVEQVKSIAADDPAPAVRVAACEWLIHRGEDEAAVEWLLDVCRTSPNHFDIVAAAGALFLIDSFAEYGDEIIQTATAVQSRMKSEPPQSVAGNYVDRVVARMKERVKLDQN